MSSRSRLTRATRATNFGRVIHAPRFTQVTPEKGKVRATRYSRYSRFSRHSRFSVNKDEDFKIRKSLAEYVCDELEMNGRHLFYQRVSVFAKNNVIANVHGSQAELDAVKEDYKSVFKAHLDQVILHCDTETFTEDFITGLFLCMGDYTLLIVEGTEDMVGEFLLELSKDIQKFWLANRVFLVEDKIDKIYFDSLNCRQSIGVNINEKFAISTPNDEELMRSQHWKIKEKLHVLCNALMVQLQGQEEYPVNEQLPPEEFNKLLPEVQRIDLVLASTHFYSTMEVFAEIYGTIPTHHDEDGVVWPVPYNYTPMGVFKRSPYDVNLTFSDYGKEKKDSVNADGDDGSAENSAAIE